MSEIPGTFKHQRYTAAQWTANNYKLKDGELAFEIDTGKAKINLTGADAAWNSLNYAFALYVAPLAVPALTLTSSTPTQIGYSFTPSAGVTYTISLLSSSGALLSVVATTGTGSFTVPGGTYGLRLTAVRTSDGFTVAGSVVTQATNKGSLATGLVESYPFGEASGTRTGLNGSTLAVHSGGAVGSTTGLRCQFRR